MPARRSRGFSCPLLHGPAGGPMTRSVCGRDRMVAPLLPMEFRAASALGGRDSGPILIGHGVSYLRGRHPGRSRKRPSAAFSHVKGKVEQGASKRNAKDLWGYGIAGRRVGATGQASCRLETEVPAFAGTGPGERTSQIALRPRESGDLGLQRSTRAHGRLTMQKPLITTRLPPLRTAMFALAPTNLIR
jgi:hypothetical protein